MLAIEGSFASKLRQLRLRKGWTQHQLAREAGVRERQIIRWENAQHEPRLEHLTALARALGVKVDELMSSSDDEEDEDQVTRIRRIRAELVLHGHDDLADDLKALIPSGEPGTA